MYNQKKIALIKNVIIYTRATKIEDGGELYLHQQEVKCREFAEKNGWNVVEVVREVACGMLDLWSRSVLKKALDDASKYPPVKNKCVVLVSSPDRMFKNVEEVSKFFCRDNEVKAVFVGVLENKDNLMVQVQAALTLKQWKDKYPERCENEKVLAGFHRNTVGWSLYNSFYKDFILKYLEHGFSLQQTLEFIKSTSDNVPLDIDDLENILKSS